MPHPGRGPDRPAPAPALATLRAMTAQPPPVAVGLVGAGPWAHYVHAPVLAAGPDTRSAGIWARRPEAAAALAAQHGDVPVFERYEDLLEVCEAVAFSVPPDVQATMAPQAARAGKALLLEKPVALDVAAAEQLAEAVDAAGVPTQLVLSWRYAPAVRALLRDVAGLDVLGARAHFLSGAFLGGPFATPWRLEHGPLFDLGPHMIDVLDAALGTVVGVRAHGDPQRWVGLLLEHDRGAVSEVSLTGSSGVEGMRSGVEVHTHQGVHAVDGVTAVDASTFVTMAREFAAAVRTNTPHTLDVHRGVHLQRLLAAALADLGR